MDELLLDQVTVVHRHGARTPISATQKLVDSLGIKFKDCKLDLFHHKLPIFLIHHSIQQAGELQEQLLKVSNLSCFFGQLTFHGKEALNQLGAKLRSSYVMDHGFLSKRLNPDQIYLASTNYIRTIESLQYLVDGLYPETERGKSPLHVWIKEEDKETMSPNYTSCAHLIVETMRQRNILVDRYENDIKDALERVGKLKINDESSKPSKIYRYYDLFSSLIGNNIPLPKGISLDDVKKLEDTQMKIWAEIYDNEEICRLAIGRFLPEWTRFLKERAEGDSNIKLAIFSGHDTSVQPILSAMQLRQPEYPGYASNIILELYKQRDRRYVRMIYNGKPLDVPACQAPGNHREGDSTLCTYDAFMSRIKKMSISEQDYKRQCERSKPLKFDWD